MQGESRDTGVPEAMINDHNANNGLEIRLTALDTEGLREAEDRLSAYQSGELAVVDADEIFRELDQRT